MNRLRLCFVILCLLLFIGLPEGLFSQTDKPCVTIKAAVLHGGPYGTGSPELARLAAGTPVTPMAAYGGFIKVRVTLGKAVREGFVEASALENLPADLPKLRQDQVPWRELENVASWPAWNYWLTWIEDGKIIHNNMSPLYGGYSTTINDYTPIVVPDPFDVILRFTGRGVEYGVLLCGKLNTHGDWWRDIRRLDVRVYDGFLSLVFYDGTKPAGPSFALPRELQGKTIRLRFQDKGRMITLLDPDGKDAGQKPVTLAAPLFPDNVVYAGFNAGPGAMLEVSAFALYVPPSGQVMAPEQAASPASPTQSPPLRELAKKRGFQIGAMISGENFQGMNIFTREFNRLVSEDFHWANIRPGRDAYDFKHTDLLVAFAERNHIPVEAHHLVWGAPEHLPGWLVLGNFSKKELLAILHDHINTVVSRYKGRVHTWSIANEVTSRRLWGNGEGDFWYTHIGPEYVELSFRWAREADPNAVLMLNENDNESTRTTTNRKITDSMYDLVKKLRARGVPIDAVGMQMHILLPFGPDQKHPPTKQDVVSVMKRFAGLGVDIYVTEFDLNLHEIRGGRKEKWAFEAKVYKDMLEACLEVPACKGFSIFGISDKYSWYNTSGDDLNLPKTEPLPFDDNYDPKPAYYAMQEVLARK
jgi:endo-1,4-beta-xylanase